MSACERQLADLPPLFARVSAASAAIVSQDSISAATAAGSGTSSAACRAGSTCRASNSATGTPLPTWAATVAPAEVPSRKSAAATSAPASASAASTPVSQAMPASPPPPSTRARPVIVCSSQRLTPTSTGSTASSTPNTSRTRSRISRASADHVGRAGAARVDQGQGVLGRDARPAAAPRPAR